MCEVNEYKDIK